MITTTIIYDRRKKADKEHKGMIEIRITANRKSYYISTGVRVYKHKWKDGYIINMPDAPELNERLRILTAQVNRMANECLEAGQPLDVARAKAAITMTISDGSHRADMLDWIGKQIGMLNVAEGTLKHYKTLETRLTEYNGLTRWSDLTTENIYKFDAWLHQLKKPQTEVQRLKELPQEPISDATVYNYHKCLKALLSRAEKFGVITSNPYNRLRGEFARGEHPDRVNYLTEDELAKFINLETIPGTLADVAHDLFIFQVFTGLSYSDMMSFSIEDYKLIDGKWMNVGERVKTGVAYISQLLPRAVAVLEKYGMAIPHLDNADYNHALKPLGVAAGISKPLHSHMGRHTFATMMLSSGAKIENVSRMLGHTNITQTQRYARVLAKDIQQDFDKLADKFK